METPRLLSSFDVAALDAAPASLVAIDAGGTMVWMNTAWTAFALANGGPEVPERFGIGASYFAGISGELRRYFEEAFATCLVDQKPFDLDYECSSPERYRLHHLRALPIRNDGLLLEHSAVIVQPHNREPHAALEHLYRDDHGIVYQCGNCRRTKSAAGSWDWVPDWVGKPPPRTSHGICKVCVGYYFGEISARARG